MTMHLFAAYAVAEREANSLLARLGVGDHEARIIITRHERKEGPGGYRVTVTRLSDAMCYTAFLWDAGKVVRG